MRDFEATKNEVEAQVVRVFAERLSRRELLQYGGLAGMSLSAVWALACQPAAPAPTPTKAPVAVAPTPTAPPAPAAPTPTKAPPPTPTPEKIGKHLIGKLEGPEVVTDPAKFPKAFKEAPELADLVKAGKLPPVKERIGEDPLVIKPVHEIGKYGGTWRRGFTGPGDKWNGYRELAHDNPIYWDYTVTKLVPNMAKGWEVSDGGRTTTIFLRRGMKWSDGRPLTADDFMFWYEDIYLNKDLTPIPTVVMTINFKPVVMEKVDTYTVRWKCPDPYYLLSDVMAGQLPLGGHATKGELLQGGFAPAHYLKQFHPKYVSKEELDRKVKEAKFDNWVSLMKFKNDWTLNTESPTVAAWKTTSPINTPTWAFERNPYSIWVDTEGNQLPYIGKVVMTLAENLEVLNLRAIAGEYDYQSRHTDLAKLPVFLANQEKGGYKVYLDPGANGADCALFFNMSYEGDPEIAKWFHNRDFRRALSLGVDRDQINEIFFLGTGTPGSQAPEETSLYSPGPDSIYRKLWSTYDPKKANEMLDKIGLDKKDAEGYRLRTDGKGRLRIEVMTEAATFMQFTQICEMIKQHWKGIAIYIDVAEIERSLNTKRKTANEQQMCTEINAATENMFGESARRLFPFEPNSPIGALYGTWFATGGQKGKEPPPPMRELMDKFRKAYGVPEKERIELAKDVWKIALDEVWTIGTVGLSAAFSGVRIVKKNMGNIPARLVGGSPHKPPGPARPESYFFKS